MSTITAKVAHVIPYSRRQQLRACASLPLRLYELFSNYWYDLKRFMVYSSTLQFFNLEQQKLSWIDADAHKLEKGLALSAPRPGFGVGVVARLIRQINEYRNTYSDNRSLQNAVRVLGVYKEFNHSNSVFREKMDAEIEQLQASSVTSQGAGGYEMEQRNEWLEKANIDFMTFVKSRRSVREFSDETVDPSLLRQAVEMAIYTPTVCNRQAARAHVYTDPQECRDVLSCQKGNGGFGDQIKAVLMVTVDRRTFFTAGERNQCWIDGGLFSMSLLYSLHSLGLGACSLNWSAVKEQDQRVREVTKIHEGEAVIMMIGVGHLKDEFKVAMSPRKPLSHFYIPGIPKE